MINRTKMPRQLRNKGGITNVISRKKYGIGSDLKDFTRKIIPNEIADVAVKVAPIVAPFNPGVAGLMRGIGRFDQRGSISDALKQGIATTAFGAGSRFLGGAENIMGGGLRGGFTSPLSVDRTKAVKSLFKGKEVSDADSIKRAKSIENTPEFMKTATEATIGKVPLLEKLPPMVQQQLLVGGVTAGASALYSYFTGEFEPQKPGETMGEYMARRNTRVKQQMRGYMDSYYTPLRNPQYAAMSDEEKNNFINGIVGEQNDAMMATGGRVGYQVGGISSANTLAENIARNRANQSFIKQFFQPAGVQMTYTGTPSADKIAKEGFKAGRPTGGFKLRAADLFQKGPKTFTTPNIDVAKTYGKTIPVLSSTGNVRLPSGGIPGSTLGQAIKNIGQTKFGTEVIQTPEQATKGMQLAKKAQDRATRGVSSAAKRLVAGETVKGLGSKVGLGTLAKNVLGRANLPLTVGMTAFDIAKETPTIQKVGTSIGEGLYNLLNPEAAAATPTQDDKIYINSEGTVTEKPRYIPGTPYNYRGDVLHLGDDPAANLSEALRKRYPKSLLKPTMADVAGPTPDADELSRFTAGINAANEMDAKTGARLYDYEKLLREYKTSQKEGTTSSYFSNPEMKQKFDSVYSPNQKPTMADVAGPKEGYISLKEYEDMQRNLMYDFMKSPGNRNRPKEEIEQNIKNIVSAASKDPDNYLRNYMGNFDSIIANRLASGGRVGLMGGTMPMGEPRVNQGGITELDYRAKGGFVPVGIKEKADDVPAMLSKNEFVFTADAVRGAGNGSIEKGAQKMYDTMKNLERRVV